MPKVYDCFIYFNEDLLLSLRLETLHKVVDTFVIAEATYTHTGRPKPLNFNPARFAKFADKIVYLVVDDHPLQVGHALTNEIHQRNALMRGLTAAAPDDRVIVSDVDEIPKPEAIMRYRPWYLYGTFFQKFYAYFLNNLGVKTHDPRQPRWWIRSKITTVAHLKNFFGTPQNLRIYKKQPGLSGLLHQIHRKVRHQRLYDGGWHFSWVMTPEQMIQKIESYSHTEHDIPAIKSVDAIRTAIQAGQDILKKGERFRLVELDASFPPYLREHLDQFREWYLDPIGRTTQT
jgi:beta-1,4-mannosyl-glycoprotein beta-1,4-N-acetylglucosaminyltransferase